MDVAVEVSCLCGNEIFLQRALAKGGNLKYAALPKGVTLETVESERIVDILIQAKWHIGFANDMLVGELCELLVKGDRQVIDYLWEHGVLDSVEFGRRVLMKLKECRSDRPIGQNGSRLRIIAEKTDEDVTGVGDDVELNVETVIIRAASENCYHLLDAMGLID
ncbi:hypothetical protein HDU76_011837 [Blyttiomyces sp. JEL0837]|nr:hypothetical protein HDU76_011837 [Blyttiomyces sp. JEL0837]